MKEKLKKFFRKFEDLLVYLSGSMLAIFLAAAQGYTSNMATFLIIFTVNTVLIFSLIGFFIKKGGD